MPVYQGVTLQSVEGQQLRNVYYYETTSPLDNAQLQEATDAFYDAYETFQAEHALSVEWCVRGMEWRRVDVADLPTLEFDFTSGTQCGDNSSAVGLPTQVAMLLRAKALTTFPRNARTYQGGFNTSSIGGAGFFTGVAADAGEAFLNEIMTITVTGDSLQRVAVQWEDNPEDPHVVVDWNVLEQTFAERNPVIQRRRRQGQGI